MYIDEKYMTLYYDLNIKQKRACLLRQKKNIKDKNIYYERQIEMNHEVGLFR
jgi:hypothetical protein